MDTQQVIPSQPVAYSPEDANRWLTEMEAKILAGYEPTLEEQREIVAKVRNNRFAAAAASTKSKGGSKKKAMSDSELDSDLDSALGL